jgi:hypothetical protein
MGTSKSYSAPTTGPWPGLKGQASRFARNASSAQADAGALAPAALSLLGQFVAALGGAAAVAGRLEGAAAPGALVGGAAAGAIDAGQRLGGFADGLQAGGLAEGLRRLELADLEGHPADDVADALVERLAGNPDGLEDAAAVAAAADLKAELLGDAETWEEADAALREAVEAHGVGGILILFFSGYLYVRLCQMLGEQLARTADGSTGEMAAPSVIREVIRAEVRARVAGRDAADVDWSGDEGRALAAETLKDVLHIFEVEADVEG